MNSAAPPSEPGRKLEPIIIALLPLYAARSGGDAFMCGWLSAAYPLMQFVGAPLFDGTLFGLLGAPSPIILGAVIPAGLWLVAPGCGDRLTLPIHCEQPCQKSS